MVTPSNPTEQRIWDMYADQIKASVAQAPPLTPEQIRALRAALPRKATNDSAP